MGTSHDGAYDDLRGIRQQQGHPLAVAVAEGGLRGEVRFWGTIPNQPEAVRKLVAKLAAKHSVLSFCYG
jgi:hypothetical protein